MRARRWGRVINVSSVAAQFGGVVGPHYAGSKAGMLGLTHAYASLLAQEGITVNAIAPALIATEMIASNPRARPDLRGQQRETGRGHVIARTRGDTNSGAVNSMTAARRSATSGRLPPPP